MYVFVVAAKPGGGSKLLFLLWRICLSPNYDGLRNLYSVPLTAGLYPSICLYKLYFSCWNCARANRGPTHIRRARSRVRVKQPRVDRFTEDVLIRLTFAAVMPLSLAERKELGFPSP